MKLIRAKGDTNVTVYVFVQDSSATDGSGLTGLVWNSASLVASQVRPLAARVAITLATQTVTGAHSDGGFVEVDATNMPGVYRLDLPDAVCAAGVDSVVVILKGATNMAPVVLEIQLTDLDPNDGTRAGLTALPNAAADGAGGLPISDAGGLDLDTQLAATNEITAARMGALTDWIDGGRLDLIVDAILVDTAQLGAAVGASISADIAAVKAETALIVADTNELQTDDVPGLIAALNDISAANVNTEVLDVMATDTLVDGKTIQEAIRYCSAVLAGKVSGAGTGTETFVGLDGATNRVQGTVDTSGNRTAVTLDP